LRTSAASSPPRSDVGTGSRRCDAPAASRDRGSVIRRVEGADSRGPSIATGSRSRPLYQPRSIHA
jgi:hypothetical protein